MTFSHALSTNNYGPAKFIVSANVYEGTHTTIATALTSASSGDTIFIRPGTYTENLTLKAGVNLTSFGSDSSLNKTGDVIISGTCTLTTAGSVTISGIQLQTNSAALLAVTGTLASVVNLNNCYLNISNNTGITYSSSSGSSGINLFNCVGDLGTTGIGIYTATGAGSMTISNTIFNNSGGSSTASTNSTNTIFFIKSVLASPITTSSVGILNLTYTSIDTSAQNVTTITTAGTGPATSVNGFYSSGSASTLSIGTGTTFTSYNDSLVSSNTNVATGAGTWTVSSVNFGGTSSANNVTAINLRTLQGGEYRGRIVITAPSAGMIGEYIRGYNGSGTSLSTTVLLNVTSISLTPGIWDVSCVGEVVTTGLSTVAQIGISTSTNSQSGSVVDSYANLSYGSTAVTASVYCISIPSFRVSLSATTTYYLIASSAFSTGTGTGYGRISGTRVS